MRKWIWISVGGSAVALVAAALGLRPLIRSQLTAQAAARGVRLQFESLEVGYPHLTLGGVRVELEGVAGVQAELHQVVLGVGLGTPRLRAFEVRGGAVRLAGSPEELVERLAAFRQRFPGRQVSAGSDRAASAERREVARALRVAWTLDDGRTLEVSGFNYERLPGAPRRLGADLIRLATGTADLSIAGAEAHLAQDGAALARLSVAEARLLLHPGDGSSDAPVAPGAEPPGGGAAEPPGGGAAVPAGGGTQAPARGGAAALAGGSAAVGSTTQDGLAERLVVHPERVARVRALLRSLRERVAPKLPAEMGIEELFVGVRSGQDAISIGPSRLSIRRSVDAVQLSLLPGADAQGTPLELAARLPLSEHEPLTVRVNGGPVSLASLGVREGDFGLRSVGAALVGAEAELELSSAGDVVKAKGTAFADNLALLQPKLTDQEILVPRLTLRGEAEAAVDGSRYQFTHSEIRLNGTRFEGDFSLERRDSHVLLDAQLKAPLVSCQALADSAPRALLGSVADLRYSGMFSLDVGVKADSSALARMEVHLDFRNGCKISRAPADLDPMQFRGLFSREVLGPGQLPMQMDFGPPSEHWVDMREISPFMEAALLVTEDGRFFRHDGFDLRAIESAIRDNTRAGRFVRGASTISMQLAKNLYLSREKTLSRKFREAALTMLLEQTFDKRELLELYLNVVEFGPGIYGIGPAAAYYFSTTPKDLSAAQSFFLASILPAPSVRYFDAEGNLSAARTRHVRFLLGVAHGRGGLTDEQLAAGLREELKFGVAHSPTIEVEIPEDRGAHAVADEEGLPLALPEPDRPPAGTSAEAAPSPVRKPSARGGVLPGSGGSGQRKVPEVRH